MNLLEEFPLSAWRGSIPQDIQSKAIESLEDGKVLVFPHLSFALHNEEHALLSPHFIDPSRKNISFDPKQGTVTGVAADGEEKNLLKAMLKRYAQESMHLMQKLFPHYIPVLNQGRTSFRPAEIAGRKSSVRKDDTRLHIDAFPSSPTKGSRILRFFTNINPDGKPRVWRVGEPFHQVVEKFASDVPLQLPGSASLLKLLKITKEHRTPYDHYMLRIHNKMKEDMEYQKTVEQQEVLFAPGSSWIVYTDQVSHAALSGQHVLEQTFSLPPHALSAPEKAPLKILEKYLSRSLLPT